MPRVEEARRTGLREGLAGEVGLGRIHLVARVDERRGDTRDVLGRAGPVERVVGPLVRLHRAEVGGFRFGVGLDLLVQSDDVVGERDEILARDRLDLGELPLAPTPASEGAEAEECGDRPTDDQEPGRKAPAALVAGRLGRPRPDVAHAAREVHQDGGDSLLVVGEERTGRERRGLIPREVVADRPELVTHDDRVDALPAETFPELERDIRARAAGLAARRRRQDRDEERSGAALLDRAAQLVRLGLGQRVGARVDVDRVRSRAPPRPGRARRTAPRRVRPVTSAASRTRRSLILATPPAARVRAPASSLHRRSSWPRLACHGSCPRAAGAQACRLGAGDVGLVHPDPFWIGEPHRELHPLADLVLRQELVRDPDRRRVRAGHRPRRVDQLSAMRHPSGSR